MTNLESEPQKRRNKWLPTGHPQRTNHQKNHTELQHRKIIKQRSVYKKKESSVILSFIYTAIAQHLIKHEPQNNAWAALLEAKHYLAYHAGLTDPINHKKTERAQKGGRKKSTKCARTWEVSHKNTFEEKAQKRLAKRLLMQHTTSLVSYRQQLTKVTSLSRTTWKTWYTNWQPLFTKTKKSPRLLIHQKAESRLNH